MPDRFREALVVMIPKSDGSRRPLSLASALWRIGASCLVHGLRTWTASWADAAVFGGVSGRGVLDAHLVLQCATEDPASVFVSEDLSKFFDSIDVSQATSILRRLRAPE